MWIQQVHYIADFFSSSDKKKWEPCGGSSQITSTVYSKSSSWGLSISMPSAEWFLGEFMLEFASNF